MKLRKSILAACAIASKAEPNRPALQGVYISGGTATGSDGYAAIRTPAVEADPSEDRPLLLDAQTVAETVKLSKAYHEVLVTPVGEDSVRLVGSGGLKRDVLLMTETYPDVDHYFKPTTRPLASIKLDIVKLKNLLSALILAQPDNDIVVLHIHSDKETVPMLLRTHNDEGTTTAVLMPVSGEILDWAMEGLDK